ncbi:MAG: ice-binding family protein [Gallionella sp.]|nr:ice-binding family protein [Gallionella sp.]
MNRFENITKPLRWFMTFLLIAFVTGCGGGGGGTGSVAPAATKAITAYSLAGATGAINETAKTIAVTLPYGTNITALVATFTTTGTSVKIGATDQTSATTANDFTSPVVYTVTAADNTTVAYTVVVTVAANTAKAITAYSLAGVAGTIDQVATPKTIAVTLPFGTNVTALVATFTTTGAGVTVAAAPQTSGTTANNFTSPVAYVVTATDGTTATYNVTVTVALNSAKAITAYSLAGVAGTIDQAPTPKTITVTLPFGTSMIQVATFTTTGASVKVGGVTQVTGPGAGGTSNTFPASPAALAYIVTAADGSTATYNVIVTVLATANPTAPTLGEAGRFVLLASQGVSTTGTTAVSNGDVGVQDQARSFITGFTPTGSTGGFVELTNGMSYAADDANPAPFPYPLHYATPVIGAPWATTLAMIDQSRTDLGNAYTFLAADPNPGAPTQVCPIELGGLTLTAGVYKTASNVGITTGTLNLDAQGDPNAVWIFSIDGTFTTGAPGGNIAFVGGVGQAKNVYWRVAGVTTIGANTIFKGSVFAYANVDVLSGANITGSLFSTTAAVTLIANTVTKAP